ncbi:helix-turn-helix domain-containing protein [Sphingomonas sp. BK580]|uniref:helix-turn-helix domain-containing protein n=1 Tax=Sphingomonas sp. BK580 TaxID=2586972 RepID=UPI001621F6F6|nr:helix-turn-helix domain-containing protein [Sphingomonas sp. BK580]MBB3694089.1 cytoskeletal protein RodZ [Sphingomonas sp. BK580]
MSDGELPAQAPAPGSVGARLRAAREAQGLSLAEVAARTRVTQRFLEALEMDRLDLLPSPTYASGFARAYARAVGLDQADVGRAIRGELARGAMPLRQHHIEEIADPSRAPSRGLVIVAAGLALAVLVLGVLWLSTGMFRGTTEQAPEATPSAQVASSKEVPPPAPTPAATGKVVLTARTEVWMRVYDGAKQRLFEGTMKPGQSFEVPAGTDRPMINVGRPDQLTVTVDGREVAPLGDGKRAIKDVGISAEALAARGLPAPAPSASTTPPATAANTTTARGDAGQLAAFRDVAR